MIRTRMLAIGVFLIFAVTGCSQKSEPDYKATSTIREVMASMIVPSSDFLFNAVSSSVTPKGVEDKSPKTDEEWANVRRNAIRLIEATNLLIMEGRHVAKPGEKSENPGIELEPEQMEKLINDDRATFIKFAQGLHDAAMPALKSIDDRNADGLLDAGELIDNACENCHLKYWYPNQNAAEAAKQSGAANPKK